MLVHFAIVIGVCQAEDAAFAGIFPQGADHIDTHINIAVRRYGQAGGAGSYIRTGKAGNG